LPVGAAAERVDARTTATMNEGSILVEFARDSSSSIDAVVEEKKGLVEDGTYSGR